MRRLLLLVPLALAACGVGNVDVAKYIPREADQTARALIGRIVAGQVDSALAQIDPSLPTDSARALFETMYGLLAGASLDSMVPVGANSNTLNMSGVTTTTRMLTYQVRVGRRWFWLSPAFRDSAGRSSLVGFHYQGWTRDPITATEFSLAGKGAGHYLFLLLMATCAVFAIGTAGWVGTQRGFPRRWVWTGVALIGAGVVSVDWSSGQFHQSLFSMDLFCFGALKGGPGSPWILSLAFPVGALLAITRVRAWRAGAAAEATSIATAAPSL